MTYNFILIMVRSIDLTYFDFNMIYQPYIVFQVKLAILGAVVKALAKAAIDFVAQESKPWAYYLGVGFGHAALATGIPGAAATLYAVGSSVDLALFKSPDGSLVKLYLNGILSTQIDAFVDDVAGQWVSASIALVPGVLNKIDIVNDVNNNPAKTSAIQWLALGGVSVNDGYAIERNDMITLAIRMKDAEQDTTLSTLPIYLPDGLTLAQVQQYVNAILPEIDALSESKIEEVNVTYRLDLPPGIKGNPEPNALNERGGLITFSTSGPRASSVRIPAIKRSIMPGDGFSLTHAAVAPFVTRLTTATTSDNIRPVSEHNYNFTVARTGKKSFRR